jgi:DNA repair protein SbcD/Mre11
MTADDYLQLRGKPVDGARFIFITDLHIRTKNPKMWKADFSAALLEQIEWVCKLVDKIGASPILIGGGDIFDAPVINLERADDFVDMLDHYNVKLVTAFGNHDVEATLATSTRSLLGHLMRRTKNTIRPLPILSHEPLILSGICFWGHHYKYMNHRNRLDDDSYDDHITLETDIVDPAAPRIIVSHSMILKDAPVFEESQYTLFTKVQTNAHAILLGHYHPQQMMTQLSNAYQTQIGGPGAFMRGALSRDDLSRTPAVAVLNWAAPDLHVDFVDIDVAAPAEGIFKLEEAQAELAKSQAMDAFRLNLDTLRVQGLSVPALIEEIAKNEKIDEAVKAEALRRIGVQ